MTIHDFSSYTVIGLTLGGIIALAAIGIVLVYRVTGVLNFAHGAMGMFSTFVAWQFLYRWHQSVWISILAGLLFSLVLGFVLENAVFRWMAGRPQLVKAIVTVGILLVLQAAASLIWGNNQYHFAIVIPGTAKVVQMFGVPVAYSKLIVIAMALLMAAGLAAFLRYTKFGIAMRAVSDDPASASLWGVPVNFVGTVSWMLGSFAAAIAGILITPFLNFDTISLTILVLDALAAALIGGLVSLPLTVVGGFVLGLLETYPHFWIRAPGFPKFVALLVILLILVFRSPKSLLGRAST